MLYARYVPIQSLSKFSYYPQPHQYRYCHCNVRRHFQYGNTEKLQYRYCYCNTRCQFRYGNQENYSTGTVITTKDVSTGMVIHKITVLVLSLQRKMSFLVWYSRKLLYQYCHRDVRRQYRYGNPEYYSTGTVIETFKVNTGMVIPQNLSTHNDLLLYQ
jgi:hypothetical protein